MRSDHRRCGRTGRRETRVIRGARFRIHIYGRSLSVCEGCRDFLVRRRVAAIPSAEARLDEASSAIIQKLPGRER